MSNHKEYDDDLERNISSIRNGNGDPLSKTISIDAELFEKLYLGPKTQVSGDLRRTFANPTPLALLGFSVALFPITTAFMGWRGAGGSAVATIPCTIWFGGMLLIFAGVGEWILGNFFPFIVFMGYGCHFLVQATTFMPFYYAVAGYTTDGSQTLTPGFAASFGFYPLMLALLSFAFMLGSLRTNACFFLIFVSATTGFGLAAGAFWYIAASDAAYGTKLIVGSGASFFVADMIGWYLFFGSIIAIMELPIPDLPVGDLTRIIKARPRGPPTTKVNEAKEA